MNGPDSTSTLARVRTMQIIAGAILAGLLIFLGIAVLIRAQGGGPPPVQDRLPVLTLMAGAMLVANGMLALLLPKHNGKQQTRKLAAERPEAAEDDTGTLLAFYQTQLIIRLALLEGAGFLGGIAYLTEGHPAALGVAGLVVLLMLVSFPTADRVAAGVAELRRQVDEARHLSRNE